MKAIVDTTSLEGQRRRAMNVHYAHSVYANFEIDTLMDLNYDGHMDLVWYDCYSAGGGVKYRDDVYLYDPLRHTYVQDSLLSHGVNTSYFLNKKKITNFYITPGGGTGYELEWNGKRWVRAVEVAIIEPADDSALWERHHLRTGRKTVVKDIFDFGMPPKAILETQSIDRD